MNGLIGVRVSRPPIITSVHLHGCWYRRTQCHMLSLSRSLPTSQMWALTLTNGPVLHNNIKPLYMYSFNATLRQTVYQPRGSNQIFEGSIFACK